MSATAAARHSVRRIHDPGARRILLLIVAAAPRLKRHGRAVTSATHAKPGHTPTKSVPKPDTGALLMAIGGFHADLRSLHSKIGQVACKTPAGQRGKADILKSLLELDAALNAFATGVTSSDRAVKAAHTRVAASLNKKARATAKTALALLDR